MTEVTEQKPLGMMASMEPYFKEFEEQANEWAEKANLIKVTDASQTSLMSDAADARKALKNIRIQVERKHKELKEDSLRTGQMLDAIKRRLVGLIEPIESYLAEQENFLVIQEKKRKEALYAERVEILKPFIGEQAKFVQLGEMDQSVFETMVEGYKAAREKRVREEEEQRKAQEEARKKQEEEDRKRREELARLQKENAEKEAKLRQEQAERKKLEDERRAREEREAAELKAKQAAERKAKRAPDKVKLLALAEQIGLIPMPDLKEEEAKQILLKTQELLAKVQKFIKDKCEDL